MLDYVWVNKNPDRDMLFKEGNKRIQSDGLVHLRYSCPTKQLKGLYTHTLVYIKQKKSERITGSDNSYFLEDFGSKEFYWI